MNGMMQEVARVLNIPSECDSNGWTKKAIPNPFITHQHDQRRPATYFNWNSGVLHDHKGGHTYSLNDTVKHLGLDSDGKVSRDWRPAERPQIEALHEPPAADWQRHATEALKASQLRLWDDTPAAINARDWLHRRGLADETIQRFGLGLTLGFTKTAIRKENGKPAFLPGPGIVIPVYGDGALWALRVRALKNTAEYSKYMNLFGSKLSGSMFNADALKGQPVLMVEGEFDAMLAQQHLPGVACVTLGASSNKRIATRWKTRFGSDITLALDNDDPGQTAQAALLAQLPDARVLPVPAGKDVTDYVVDHAGDLAEWYAGSDITLADLQRQERVWFPDGLPDEVLVQLMNRSYFPDSMLQAVRVLRQGVIDGTLDPDRITMKAVLDAAQAQGVNLPQGTLYRLVSRHGGVFLTSEYPANTLLRSENKSDANRNGRPEKIYGLKTQAEFIAAMLEYIGVAEDTDEHGPLLHRSTKTEMQALGVFTGDVLGERAKELDESMRDEFARQNGEERFARKRAIDTVERIRKSLETPHVTPLEGDLSTTKGVRIALGRATIGENDTRRVIREKVGISEGSLGPYMKAAAIERHATAPIEKPVTSISDIYNHSRGIGKPLKLVARIGAETIEQAIDASENAEMSAFIRNMRVKGGEPVVVIQPPYKNVIGELPAAGEPKKRTTAPPERANMNRAEAKQQKPQVYGPEKWVQRFIWKCETVLQMRGWGRSGDNGFIEPNTGEIYETAGPLDLYELVVSRPVSTGDMLLDMARLDLSAVIRWVDEDETLADSEARADDEDWGAA